MKNHQRIYLTYEYNKEQTALSIPKSFDDMSHITKLNFINDSIHLLSKEYNKLMEVWVGKKRIK